MSCQKHRNHHCIHSHNCNQPNHKEKVKRIQSHNDPNPKSQHPKPRLSKISEVNEQQCQFMYYPPSLPNKTNQTQENKRDYVPKKQYLSLKQKYDKLNDANRHNEAKIEYYQLEMLRIVKCSDADMAAALNTKIKMEAQYISKIKALESAIGDFENDMETIKQHEEKQRKMNKDMKKCVKQLQQSQNKIKDRYTKVKWEKQEFQKEKERYKKQSQLYKNRYEILKEEFQLTTKKQECALKKFTKELQELQLQNNKLTQVLKNTKTINSSETKHQEQLISDLSDKLRKKSEDFQEIKNQYSELQNKFNEVESQKELSKQMLQTYIKAEKKRNNILSKHQEEEIEDKENKPEIVNGFDEYKKLKLQNQQLKKQLIEAKGKVSKDGHDISTIEEYILNVGASQAFRKIILEKNQTITKLIREKGAILKECSCRK